MALPINLQLLDYNLFAQLMIPTAADVTTDLELMDYNLFAVPMVANNHLIVYSVPILSLPMLSTAY